MEVLEHSMYVLLGVLKMCTLLEYFIQQYYQILHAIGSIYLYIKLKSRQSVYHAASYSPVLVPVNMFRAQNKALTIQLLQDYREFTRTSFHSV